MCTPQKTNKQVKLPFHFNEVNLTYIQFLISFRCPVGKFWHYHGKHCNELVTIPVDPQLIITCLVGSLCLVCAVIGILMFINKKCIRPKKAVTLV